MVQSSLILNLLDYKLNSVLKTIHSVIDNKMSLNADQIKFLDECKLEFSDRFTDADEDYKKVYKDGIPRPPIMHPWYTRSRYNNRDRAGGSRYNEHGNQRGRDWDNRGDQQQQGYNRERHYDRRYRPY